MPMYLNDSADETTMRTEVWDTLVEFMANVDKDVFMDEVRDTLKGRFLKAMGTEYAKLFIALLAILDAWSIDRAEGIHLDRIGFDYDVHRKVDNQTAVAETDAKYRDRLKMWLYVQNSEATIPHIRKLVWWFFKGFNATVKDPIDNYDWDETKMGLTRPYMKLNLEKHTATRPMKEADVLIYTSEIPMEQLDSTMPNLNHPRYGNLYKALVVEVHWDAISVTFRHDALMVLDPANPEYGKTGHQLGTSYLRWLDYPLREIINFIKIIKASGVQLIFRAIGGFVIHSLKDPADAAWDTINKDHHGLNSRLTADLEYYLERLERVNDANA